VVRSNTQRAAARFAHNRLALLGALAILVLIVVAFIAPLLAPQSPTLPDMSAVRAAPTAKHLLGTDEVGRDVWSRLIYGARTSLSVGFGAVAISVAIGTLLGGLAGFYGTWVDQVIMRITDTVMSVPPLLMIIVFVSLVGPSLQTVIVVIALMTWPGTARLVRGQFLTLREREYVLAARVLGAGDRRIIARHLLPNLFGPLSVVATFGVASAILVEAGLSFLGLGIKPPLSSWGVMINSAQSSNVLLNLPWLWVPPAIAISLTVLAVNFVGDGLRDALDPRARA
jgi:peptide/nickel transport system permease protein